MNYEQYYFSYRCQGPREGLDHGGPHYIGARTSLALGPPRPPKRWPGGPLHVWILEPRSHGRGALLPFGTTKARADAAASYVFASSRPPSHGRGGLLCLGTNEAPATCLWGPPLLWDQRGLRCIDGGTSCMFGSSTPPLHGCRSLLHFGTTEAPAAFSGGGGLLRIWIIEAPVAWARRPPRLWGHGALQRVGAGDPAWLNHRGPHCIGAWTSFTLRPARPPPCWRGGLLCV